MESPRSGTNGPNAGAVHGNDTLEQGQQDGWTTGRPRNGSPDRRRDELTGGDWLGNPGPDEASVTAEGLVRDAGLHANGGVADAAIGLRT